MIAPIAYRAAFESANCGYLSLSSQKFKTIREKAKLSARCLTQRQSHIVPPGQAHDDARYAADWVGIEALAARS